MPTLRIFGRIGEVAGVASVELPGRSVNEVLEEATARYGDAFAEASRSCRIWVNGRDPGPDDLLEPGDEVALLPPVSGG